MGKYISFEDVKKQWLENPEFVDLYENMEPEHKISLELVKARLDAGLTQEDMANLLGTKQSVIARLESGKFLPSLKTIYKYANATHKKVDMHFV